MELQSFQRDLVSEALLQSNPWIEGHENEKRLRSHSSYETITDLHVYQFLRDWEKATQIGIWNDSFHLDNYKSEWEKQVNVWIPKLGLPAIDMNWFWVACHRVWISQHREICREDDMVHQVQQIRLLPQPEQRTPEWYSMRESMITASDWATCLGMDPYKGMKEFLAKKSGGGVPFTGNATTEWGVKYEPVANMVYEHRAGEEIIEFGLIPHPLYSFIGASPDGITAKGRMVEIKCPPSRAIKGVIPRYYWAQVQGQLEICDLERCDFLECKLVEYSPMEKQEWVNIQYPSLPFSMNSVTSSRSVGWEFGTLPVSPTGYMEKGAVISFSAPGEEKLRYFYSHLNPTLEEVDKWRTEMELKYCDWTVVQFAYWTLTQMSCIPIFRDRKWFNEVALPKLACAWNGVRYWRAKAEELEEVGPVIFMETGLSQMNISMDGTTEPVQRVRVKKASSVKKTEPPVSDCPYSLDDFN